MEQDLNKNYIDQAQNFINSSKVIGADLKEMKLMALKNFEALGFPTKKDEDWKYTNIGPLLTPTFRANPLKEDLTEDLLNKICLKTGNSKKAIFVNGHLDESLSSKDLPIMESKFSDKKLPQEDALECLNFAYFEKAYVLLFPNNVVSEVPIEIVHITTDKAFGSIISPRIKIKVGDQCQITFLETFVHLGLESEEKILVNGLTEFEIGKSSIVEHVKSQLHGSTTHHIHKLRSELERDSSFYSFSLSLGALTSRNNIQVELNQEGSSANVHGLFVLNGEQHSDTFSIINHNSAHTESSQLYKGIMDENSHGIFTGKIHVKKDSQQIKSEQLSKNLLLSKKAQIHTRPILEIFADDVKCSHGATIGQISEDEVFYLQSRGLPKAKAQRILCKAFGVEALDKIKSIDIKNHLMGILMNKLEDNNMGHFD